MTDAAGTVVGTSSFDAYGTLTDHTGSATASLGFAGQYTDTETGFVYLRARYYDPATGQFLTRDPIESETREPYGYVGGNPLNATDPSGLLCLVHNSNGGCRGAGILKDAQKPIAAIGVAASQVAAVSSVVAATCAASIVALACSLPAEAIALGAGALSTAAAGEVAIYACSVGGISSRACRVGLAATALAGVSAGLAHETGDPFLSAALNSFNAAGSAASVRSRLSTLPGSSGSFRATDLSGSR